MALLQNKLLSRYLPIILLATLAMALVGFYMTIRQSRTDFTDRLTDNLRGVEIEFDEITAQLLDRARTVDVVKLGKFVKSRDSKALHMVLSQSIESYVVDIAEIIDRQGIVITDTQRLGFSGKDVSQQAKFRKAIAGEPASGIEKTAFGIGSSAFYPINTGGKTTGVVRLVSLYDHPVLMRIKGLIGLESIVYDGKRLQATTFMDPLVLNDQNLERLRDEVMAAMKPIGRELRIAKNRFYFFGKPIADEDEKTVGVIFLALSAESLQESIRQMVLDGWRHLSRLVGRIASGVNQANGSFFRRYCADHARNHHISLLSDILRHCASNSEIVCCNQGNCRWRHEGRCHSIR